MTQEKLNLTLYSRENCHLCEDMLIELQVASKQYNFKLTIIDIDGSKEFYDKYNTIIPFLCYEKEKECTEICKYFYDNEALSLFFNINP